jgi:sec-independent protein translocase protein TatC
MVQDLIELRQRIIYCLLCIGVLLIPLLYFSQDLYTLIATPILNTLPAGGQLIATQVITPFTIPLKLAFFTSFMISLPFILYHVWSFVAPGLYQKEKKVIRPLLLSSISLFYTGIAFAHFIVLPVALNFFMHIAPKGVTVMTDMTHYLDFVLALCIGFGVTFQVPMITILLIKTKKVSVDTLKSYRSYIIVGAFVIGMLLTPPDVISQILLAVPLILLFEGGILLGKLLP